MPYSTALNPHVDAARQHSKTWARRMGMLASLPGLGLHASITHSGEIVGVALSAAGPLGLDVEQVRERDISDLTRRVLGSGERSENPEDFFRYWTRKEAVVKATRDGIGVGLSAALRKHYSADDAERYLRQWAAEHDVKKTPKH